MEQKIGDFGLATKLEFEGDRKRTICGTPNYIAPEILDGKQGHSYEVDIWSLGVIIYTLIIGKPPFETSDVKTTYKRIRINAYSFPENVPISEQAKNLISKILNLDPTKRPSLDEIMDHPFFHTTGSIPKLLPASTLACPPSASYVRQFMPNSLPSTGISDKKQLEATAPIKPTEELKGKAKPATSGFHNTDKFTGKLGAADTIPNSSKSPVSDDKKESVGKTAVPSTATKQSSGPTVGPSIWVKKWVDYTSKYGLGNKFITEQ